MINNNCCLHFLLYKRFGKAVTMKKLNKIYAQEHENNPRSRRNSSLTELSKHNHRIVEQPCGRDDFTAANTGMFSDTIFNPHDNGGSKIDVCFDKNLNCDEELYASKTFNNSRKRLVDQFLKNMQPENTKKGGSSHNIKSIQTHLESLAKDDGNEESLQRIIFHDLESSVSKPMVEYSSSRSSINSSMSDSSESYVSSLSVISQDDISEKSVHLEKSRLSLSMNCNELDYYEQHIAEQLEMCQNALKSNIKHSVLKDEYDLQRTLDTFDDLNANLQKAKLEITQLYDKVERDYLKKLNFEFDDANSDSFISRVNKIIRKNITSFELLEDRLKKCRILARNQRDKLRKMERILDAKNAAIEKEKKAHFYCKHIHMFYDLIALTSLIFISIFLYNSFHTIPT